MLKKATQLSEIYGAISTKPLEETQDMAQFYSETLDTVRGNGVDTRMVLDLTNRFGGEWLKASLAGHPGCGKTTELNRLVADPQVAEKYVPIRFSALSDLHASAFDTADVLETMLIRLIEEASKPVLQGGAGISFGDELLEELNRWFATYTTKEIKTTSRETSMEGGLSMGQIPVLSRLLTLTGTAKKVNRNANSRTEEVVLQRKRNLPELVTLVNKTLDICHKFLQVKQQKQWLFIGDDFEKDGVSRERIKRLMYEDCGHLQELNAHFIITLPIWLIYSSDMPSLFIPSQHRYLLPDVPVYTPKHQHNVKGQKELSLLMEKRVQKNLFSTKAWNRLIVASGGNLRDLFFLFMEASSNAIISKKLRVGEVEVDKAVLRLLSDYLRSLAVTDEEYKAGITADVKTDRLVQIYEDGSLREIADPIMLSLLYSRVVQEFNGSNWYGVHPVVVDILQDRNDLKGTNFAGTRF
jgi:hypothetical protein